MGAMPAHAIPQGQATNPDAPYHNVLHALRRAYMSQSLYIIQQSSLWGRGGPETNPSALNPAEWIAQGEIIVDTVRRLLHPHQALAISALYRNQQPLEIYTAKQRECLQLAYHLKDRFPYETERMPLAFVADVVREWSSLTPNKSQDWWANELGVYSGTIQRYRRGHKHRPGVMQLLDRWRSEALKVLAPQFFRLGLIEDE